MALYDAVFVYLSLSFFLVKEVQTSSYGDSTSAGHQSRNRFHYQQISNTPLSLPTIYDEFVYEQLDISLIDKEAFACVNLRPDCDRYAAAGGCTSDPLWMLPHCPKSCHACGGQGGATDATTDSSFTYRPIPQVVPFEDSFGLRETIDISAAPVENAIRIDGIRPPQRLEPGHEEAMSSAICIPLWMSTPSTRRSVSSVALPCNIPIVPFGRLRNSTLAPQSPIL
jgi:ShK domain-like